MRLLAIGDIHGCYSALTALIDAVQIAPAETVIFLGDYIDRGPQSNEVIARLITMEKSGNVVALRGNHEVMILQARENILQFHLWSSYGGFETLISYGAQARRDWVDALPAEHWSFIERTRKWHTTERYIFVHAKVDPDLDLEEQNDYTLFWEFCDTMTPHKSGKKVICGHTSQLSGRPGVFDWGVCIDTGIHQGRWLTCLDVDSGAYWQANSSGETRSGTSCRHPSL